jgi:hypothetical protein
MIKAKEVLPRRFFERFGRSESTLSVMLSDVRVRRFVRIAKFT